MEFRWIFFFVHVIQYASMCSCRGFNGDGKHAVDQNICGATTFFLLNFNWNLQTCTRCTSKTSQIGIKKNGTERTHRINKREHGKRPKKKNKFPE